MGLSRSFHWVFLVWLFAASSACVAGPPPTCSEPACFVVAEPAAWPAGGSQSGLTVMFRRFTLQVPSSPETVASQPGLLAMVYPLGRVVLSEDHRDSIHPGLARAGMSTDEWAEIVFTNTPEDPAPGNPQANRLWNELLQTKVVWPTGAEVTRYQREGLTAYLVSGGAPHDHDVLIVDKEQPDQLFRMSVDGFDRRLVEALLGSLRQNQR